MYRENYGDMTMTSLEKLGANIKSLRCAFGETQEQLGEAIYVEKTPSLIMKKARGNQRKRRWPLLRSTLWFQLKNFYIVI